MPVISVLGDQRGDEGKGRFTDMLADELAPEGGIVARFNGGNNAGHTIVSPDGTELDTHMVPSGIAHAHIMNVIGHGALVNAQALVEEIESHRASGFSVSPDNLKLSSGAHLILPHHIFADVLTESGTEAQGTTKKGIRQSAGDKGGRRGLRVEKIKHDPGMLMSVILAELADQRAARDESGIKAIIDLDEEAIAEQYLTTARQLIGYVTDTTYYLNQELERGRTVIAEGAQSFLLDVDLGMYPDTSSTSTTIGGVITGLGIPPGYLERTIGVAKAVPSHVGGGHFVTEIFDEEKLEKLHGDKTAVDGEYGKTTGRKRRLGYFDLPTVRRALMVNGRPQDQEIALTKLDWVPRNGDSVRVCVAYERKGKILRTAPDAPYKMQESRPLYADLPTWTEDISGVRKFDDLPQAAQDFVDYLEQQVGVPINLIGVGPQRDQVIVR